MIIKIGICPICNKETPLDANSCVIHWDDVGDHCRGSGYRAYDIRTIYYCREESIDISTVSLNKREDRQ